MTTTEYTIRRLPDLEGVGADLGALFGPDDAQPGEVLVRRGVLRSTYDGQCDVVLAHYNDGKSFKLENFRAVAFHDGEWQLSKGMVRADEDEPVCAAIKSVLGKHVDL